MPVKESTNKRGLINVNALARRDLSRKLGKVVEEVNFLPGGVSCDIYMSKGSLEFTATLNNETMTDKDGAKVRAWAYQQLREMCHLAWVPVISVLDVGETAKAAIPGTRASWNFTRSAWMSIGFTSPRK